MVKKKINSLFNKKIEILLIFLLILFPSLNFILSNLEQYKLFSNIFIYLISAISIFLLLFFFTIYNFCEKKFLIKKIIFSLLFIWNLQFFFLDIKFLLISTVNDLFDGYISLIIIFSISILISEIIIRKIVFKLFVIFFLLISVSINLVNNFSFDLFNNNIKTTIFDNKKSKNLDNLKVINKPNVFYIIADGLGSLNTLNKNKIDTSFIKKYLIKNKYQIAENSKSSYTETHLTMASIFEMDYIVNGLDKLYKNNGPYFPYFEKNKTPKIVSGLNNIGYKFYWFGNNISKCARVPNINCIEILHEKLFDKIINDYASETFFSSTLIYAIYEYFLKISKISYIPLDGNDVIKFYKKILINSSDNLKKGGNFTLLHHMSPHTPMRDENCNLLSLEERMIVSQKNYETSVQCVFKRIVEISEIILSKYPKSIIIVQGDHGPVFENKLNKKLPYGTSKKPNGKVINDRIKIFNAAYLPNKCKNKFYNEIGTVETVKLVLNCIGYEEIKPKNESQSFLFFREETPSIYNLKLINLN